MKSRILLAGLAAIAAVSFTATADSRPRYRHGITGELDPNLNPYGPGHYAFNGLHVYAGPDCYVSREQGFVNGRLVWKPLSTCTGSRNR